MKIIELNEDNLSEYEDYFDADVAENIGREFFHGLIAAGEGDPAGALIWEYKNLDEDNDTESEIFFIKSDGEDAIKELLEKYELSASSNDVTRTFFEADIISDEVKDSLTGDDFSVTTQESRDLFISVSDLKSLTAPGKKISKKVTGLNEIMELQFMQGITNFMFAGKKGLMEDLEYVDMDWFDDGISSCVITDGKITGMLLIHAFPSGVLMPVFFSAMGPDATKDLMAMIVFSARKATEVYSEDTKVIIRRHNKPVQALSAKFFASKSGNKVFFGEKGV